MTSLIEPAEFAGHWDISERTLERYVQRLGIPHEKRRGRVMIKLPDAGVWMNLRLIAQGVRKANPGMSRAWVRTQARAIWLEEQGSDGDFDLE